MLSNLSLEKDINSCTKMSGSLSNGPMMRWERKLGEAIKNSYSECNKSHGDKSPKISKLLSNVLIHQDSAENSSHKKKTPVNSRSKSVGDRFIPNRSATQFELAQFLINKSITQSAENVSLSPAKLNRQKIMGDYLNGGDIENFKIIHFNQRQPEPKYGFNRESRPLFTGCNIASTKKPNRHIPSTPERILDAPDIRDDYYLNLLDWSSQNMLAVCLGRCLYLWNATTSSINVLLEIPGENEYISSVAWLYDGDHLAVGTSTAEVQIWNIEHKKRIRSMESHISRVGSLSWNEHVLSSGSRSGNIHHHDVRVANHLISTIPAHSQEVCGLKWSGDGRYLASGGNDNVLNIFPQVIHGRHTLSMPLYSFNDHIAAVKAIAWCPWQSNLLATGGGSLDQQIRFWNGQSGQLLSNINTNSQVCSILWSKDYKELISCHGFAHNQLSIWEYPKLEKVKDLEGHTARVLFMAMSPDGSTVVSASADETIRLWKCFATDPTKKRSINKEVKEIPSSVSLLSKIR